MYWCASSWLMTTATLCWFVEELSRLSNKRFVSRYLWKKMFFFFRTDLVFFLNTDSLLTNVEVGLDSCAEFKVPNLAPRKCFFYHGAERWSATSLHYVHYSRALEGITDLVSAKSMCMSCLGEVCVCARCPWGLVWSGHLTGRVCCDLCEVTGSQISLFIYKCSIKQSVLRSSCSLLFYTLDQGLP